MLQVLFLALKEIVQSGNNQRKHVESTKIMTKKLLHVIFVLDGEDINIQPGENIHFTSKDGDEMFSIKW